MKESLNNAITKLINQSTTPLHTYIDAVKPHIQSKRLIEEQQETLLEYFKHLMLEKSINLSERYIKQQFRIIRDFGASMKRPFNQVDVEDFKIFYSRLIDSRDVRNSTLESYENILKKFFNWLYEKEDRLGEWKQLAFKVKMIFNSDKIKENMKLDYKQAVENKKMRSISRYLKSINLTEEQRQVLNDYYKYLVSGSQRKVSVHCLHGNFRTLHQFGAYIKKPFNKVKRDDFTNYFYNLTQEKKVSPVTLDAYKHIIKKLYKFLHYGYLDPKQEYPEIVKHIQLDKIQIKKSRSEMLTRGEVSKLIEHCPHVMHKLMVSLAYEAITRPEEEFQIKIGDIKSDDYGFEIDINRIKQKNKDNYKLPFRIIESEPYLREWLNLHPLKNDKEAYLFISLKQTGKYVLYSGLSKVLKKVAKAAGITKRVYPYLLRHSRITHLKQEGWSDDQIKQITGHSDNSNILSNYTHLEPKDVNDMRLQKAGKLKLKENEKAIQEREALKPKKCPRCERINEPKARYCNCGMVLDLRTAMEDQKKTENTFETLAKIVSDPEKAKILKMLVDSIK